MGTDEASRCTKNKCNGCAGWRKLTSRDRQRSEVCRKGAFLLAEVAGVRAQHHISISSVIQHEPPEEHEGERVTLMVIMTHTATTGHFRAPLADLDRLCCLVPPSVYYPAGD
jgi:hypothetical protein